jgi:flavin reductase (DIM6/NTAB) family NADH-FMN oxidoreductase RutF
MLDLDSLFKLSYGMCIVASNKGDKFNGCIVNTVFQITPEPPMVAVSINKNCLTHECIEKSGKYSVAVLAEKAPMSFMGKFGFRTGREIDKFEGVDYKLGETGLTIIKENAVSFLEVKVTDKIDIYTHSLFIGEILNSETLTEEDYPMTYDYYRQVKHGKTPKSAATYHLTSDTPKAE